MVDLALSTNAYTNHSLTTAIERIADRGYAGAKLLADDPHAYLPAFTDDDVGYDGFTLELYRTPTGPTRRPARRSTISNGSSDPRRPPTVHRSPRGSFVRA